MSLFGGGVGRRRFNSFSRASASNCFPVGAVLRWNAIDSFSVRPMVNVFRAAVKQFL